MSTVEVLPAPAPEGLLVTVEVVGRTRGGVAASVIVAMPENTRILRVLPPHSDPKQPWLNGLPRLLVQYAVDNAAAFGAAYRAVPAWQKIVSIEPLPLAGPGVEGVASDEDPAVGGVEVPLAHADQGQELAQRLVAVEGRGDDVTEDRDERLLERLNVAHGDASGSSMGGTSEGRGAAAGRSAAAPVTAQALIQFIEDTLGIGLFPWQHAEVERTFGDFR